MRVRFVAVEVAHFVAGCWARRKVCRSNKSMHGVPDTLSGQRYTDGWVSIVIWVLSKFAPAKPAPVRRRIDAAVASYFVPSQHYGRVLGVHHSHPAMPHATTRTIARSANTTALITCRFGLSLRRWLNRRRARDI